MRFHHVGIVVPKITNSIPEITRFINFDDIIPTELIESQRVNVSFIKFESVFLELIEPVGENSPVSKFAEKGGGIHHLCFEVKNINEKINELKAKGATVIVSPVKGFEGRLISFVYLNMKNTSCNLIELAEEK